MLTNCFYCVIGKAMADGVSPNACDAEGYAPMCCSSENGVCSKQPFESIILDSDQDRYLITLVV